MIRNEMIKNERQYRISKAQSGRIEQALLSLETQGVAEEVHPLLHQAQLDALKSQRDSLLQKLTDYEALI